MLAIVALLAAYTGYASAKWNTESSVQLAQASAARTEANRAGMDAENLRNFDSTRLNTWFTAYVAGDTTSESAGCDGFVRPSRWPSTPGSPPIRSPTRRHRPSHLHARVQAARAAVATTLNNKATEDYAHGVQAGSNADNYIRDTILATILFLIGISGHFRFLRIRVSLVVLTRS